MARLGPRNQSEPSVDNPVMQSLYEEANAVQQQEEEFQGKQGFAPSILTSGEINQLDSEFNNSEYVTNYWDSVYNTYIEEHAKAVEAGNMDEVAVICERRRGHFHDVSTCSARPGKTTIRKHTQSCIVYRLYMVSWAIQRITPS